MTTVQRKKKTKKTSERSPWNPGSWLMRRGTWLPRNKVNTQGQKRQADMTAEFPAVVNCTGSTGFCSEGISFTQQVTGEEF